MPEITERQKKYYDEMDLGELRYERSRINNDLDILMISVSPAATAKKRELRARLEYVTQLIADLAEGER